MEATAALEELRTFVAHRQHRPSTDRIITDSPQRQETYLTLGGLRALLPIVDGALEQPKAKAKDPWQETVLEEAQRLIYGPRMAEYGSALVSFGRIAGLWNAYLAARGLYPKAPLVEEDVAFLLVLLKAARAIEDLSSERPVKRDSVVDVAGYAGCVQKITDDREELTRG